VKKTCGSCWRRAMGGRAVRDRADRPRHRRGRFCFLLWVLVSAPSKVKGAIAAIILGPQVVWLGLDVIQQDAKSAC